MTRFWQEMSDGAGQLLIDPDGIFVTFFIPLPDFISIPADQAFATNMPLDSSVVRWLESFEEVPPRNAEEKKNPKYRNLTGSAMMSSSIIFRRHAMNFIEASELPLMVKMFDDFTLGGHDHETLSDLDDLADEHGQFFRSVAEVAVSLDYASLQESFSSDAYDTRFRSKEKVPQEAIEKALEVALNDVRHWQSAYYGTTRSPITLIERELLPPILLYSLQTLSEISNKVPPIRQTLITGTGPNKIGLVEEMTESEISTFKAFSGTQSPMMRYLDLYRQGTLALKQGNARECIVMISVAAESLLNVLLAHLQWEDCWTPETSAASWSDSLVTRVRTEFHPKLGGVWDTSKPGPVQDWDRYIANVRHKVVHAGHKPSIEEAKKSVETLESLLGFLGDRVVHSGNLKKYTRTAVTLIGVEGLKKRSRHTNAVKSLMKEPDAVNWNEAFGRWYETQILCIQDQKNPRRPEVLGARYLIVFLAQNSHHWVVSDWGTRKAAKVTVTMTDGVEDPVQQLFNQIPNLKSGEAQYPVSAQVADGVVSSAVLGGDWVENYHLLPLMGVMRDGSDFTR